MDEHLESGISVTRRFFGEAMPRPAITADTAEFWSACARHKLMIQRCTNCGTFRMNPAPVCFGCRSFANEWVESRGQGHVFTYTIVHHPVHPAMNDAVPYNAVVITLADCGNVRLTSNIIDCAPEDVRIGMPVELVWEDLEPGLALYRFRRSTAELATEARDG